MWIHPNDPRAKFQTHAKTLPYEFPDAASPIDIDRFSDYLGVFNEDTPELLRELLWAAEGYISNLISGRIRSRTFSDYFIIDQNRKYFRLSQARSMFTKFQSGATLNYWNEDNINLLIPEDDYVIDEGYLPSLKT